MYLATQSRRQRGRGRLRGTSSSSSIRIARLGWMGSPWKQYQEQVIARQGGGRYTILLREDPLTLGGLGVAINPGTIGPWSVIGPAVVSKSGGTASSALLSAGSVAAQGFALGGPIGAGIGALAGAIAGIWASHAARAAGAKSENAALNSAVQAFDASLKAVFAAANSGQVTGAQAAQACQTILQNYWQGMVPYMVGPGRSDCSKGGMNCSCSPSNCGTKTCTAGCCAGCFDIMPSISSAVAALSSPTGGTAQISEVYPSKYGTTMRSAYQLTYTPPSAASVAGVANSLSSSVAGIPLWLIAAAGLGLYVAMQ